jgi:HTH-type transcriptional regulator/antitoxin HigA
MESVVAYMKLNSLLNIIGNEREYRMTKSLVRQFERAIEQLDGLPELTEEHRAVVAASYRGKVRELTQQLAQYDRLRGGQVPSVTTEDLASVGRALIAARIARKWTQADLARALGVKPQQVQKDESSDYASASLDRVAAVAAALGAEFQVHVAFTRPEQAQKARQRRASSKPQRAVRQAELRP